MVQMQDVMSKPMPDFREGSIVKGRILEVRPREVLVDIGYKSEGVISLAEFEDVENLEVGDEVDVLLERLENDEGMRSEEHTSELQSRQYLVCRLLLEKKKHKVKRNLTRHKLVNPSQDSTLK